MQHLTTLPANKDDRAIVAHLVDSGLITQSQVDLAHRQQRAAIANNDRGSVLDMLVRSRFISREQVADTLRTGSTNESTRALLPRTICVRYCVCPTMVSGNELHLIAGLPLTGEQKNSIITACLNTKVSILSIKATDQSSVKKEIQALFQEQVSLIDYLERLRREETTGLIVQQTVNALLSTALDSSASDVHIDFQGDQTSCISFRIDGEIKRSHLVPRTVAGPILMRIKTLCGMDASETRRDQDGRLSFNHLGRDIDFRVNTMPMPVTSGEAMVLRALDPDRIPSVDSMFPGQVKIVETIHELTRFKEKRGGLVVISGVTGSGKSTTLYAFNQKIPRDRINFITVEDPVEFTLPLARQYQINPMLNQNMAEIERSLLRQDLDAAMIGEIRSQDSARLAFAVAESGHMCFTTIHAKNAMQTIARLINFFPGEDERERAAFIISQFAQLIINQKLIRKLCDHCKVETDGGYAPNHEGCESCGGTGFKGRILVHDTMIFKPNEDGREEIYRCILSGDFKKIAYVTGVTHQSRDETVCTLRDAGLLSVEDAREQIRINV